MYGRFPTVAIPLAVLGASLLRADDWPQWRGPDHNGISRETAWSDHWEDSGPKVAWKAEVGLGFSSFSVADGRAVTLGHADENDTVTCLDMATGKTLWTYRYPAELGDKYFDGGTTGTPVIDGGRVYGLSRWGDVFCLDAATGAKVWTKNIQKETDARLPDWGFGGAPLVHGKTVVLNVGESGVALDRATGAIIWKSAPKAAGYSTPVPVKSGDKTLGLVSSGNSYSAVDLVDGKPVWSVRWLTQYGVNASDPILSGDRLFVSTGYGKGAAMYKIDGGAEPAQLWKSKTLRTQLNGAVLLDGYLFGVDGDTTEKASLKCVEFATGTEKWAVEGFGSGGVTIAGGKLIALGGTGELTVGPATPSGFKPTSRAQVIGGKTWTAPVLANGRLLVRNSRGSVVCLDLR